MIRLNINEHYINLWGDDDSKLIYLDEIWKLIEDSYKKIGGCSKNKNELLDSKYLWKMVKRGSKITAVTIYKIPGGRKLVIAASDGTSEGKNDLYSILREDISEIGRGVFGEYSGALEHLMNKFGAQPIPADVAEKILNDMNKDILSKDPDGFHYTRLINGIERTKIMFGNFGGQE